MSRKCKKIITIIMVVLYIILFSNNICNAMVQSEPYKSLFGSTGWFCIQHGGFLRDSCDISRYYRKYEDVGGDKWNPETKKWDHVPSWGYTYGHHETVTGTITGHWTDGSPRRVDGTCTSSQTDRMLAYVLATGSGHGSSQSAITNEQRVLWSIWNSGLASVNENKEMLRVATSNRFVYDDHKIGFMTTKEASMENRVNMKLASTKKDDKDDKNNWMDDEDTAGITKSEAENEKANASFKANNKSYLDQQPAKITAAGKEFEKVESDNHIIGPMRVQYNGYVESIKVTFKNGDRHG